MVIQECCLVKTKKKKKQKNNIVSIESGSKVCNVHKTETSRKNFAFPIFLKVTYTVQSLSLSLPLSGLFSSCNFSSLLHLIPNFSIFILNAHKRVKVSHLYFGDIFCMKFCGLERKKVA